MVDNILDLNEAWLPGSFTKNFAWGKGQGLKRLYDNIRIGFDNRLAPVTREEYLERVGSDDARNLVPLNFFLFNTVENGTSTVQVDEIVFQALTSGHSDRFDKLALFAINFSHAGRWKRQKSGQRYPAIWATSYVVNRIARDFNWDARRVDKPDIEVFLANLPRFQTSTAYKVSRNLDYIYKAGELSGVGATRITRWWVDALFLALDRIVGDRALDGLSTPTEALPNLLLKKQFLPLTGPVTAEKSLAIAHLLSLYSICGGRLRFDQDRVNELVAVELRDYTPQIANDFRPQGALHPTNPRILKTIPRECAELAKLAGFDIVLPDELDDFDPNDFIRQRASSAADSLKRDKIQPIMSPEELHKLTRGE